jgi:branched-chain amino acid transport system substrate-binding protein
MTAFPMTVNVAAATALIGAANKLWPNANYYTLDADYVWGHQMRDTLLAAMKALGGTEIGNSAFPVGTTDFSTLLTAAQSAKPDVLLCVALGADQVNLAKQIISFGVQKTMNVVFPLTQQIVAYEAGGPATFQGIYCGTDWVWEVENAGYPWSADAKTFSDAYWQRTGHPPDPYSLGTYVGLKEYAAACERAGTTEPNAVIQALGNHQFSYAKGPETWRPCDLQAIQDWFIVQGKTPEESQNEYDIFKVKAKAGTDNPDLYFQTPASLGCTSSSTTTST